MAPDITSSSSDKEQGPRRTRSNHTEDQLSSRKSVVFEYGSIGEGAIHSYWCIDNDAGKLNLCCCCLVSSYAVIQPVLSTDCSEARRSLVAGAMSRLSRLACPSSSTTLDPYRIMPGQAR